MPNYSPIPRSTTAGRSSRERRAVNAFHPPGGSEAGITAFVNGPITYDIIPPVLTILGNTTGGTTVANLPSVGTQFYRENLLTVKKIDSSTDDISLVPISGETIDGETQITFGQQYAGIQVISDGDEWRIVGTNPLDPVWSGHVIEISGVGATISRPIQSLIVTTGASSRTVTLPDTNVYKGCLVTVKKVDSGAGTVIIDGAGGDTIDGAANTVLTNQWESVTLLAVPASPTNTWYIVSKYP